MTPMLRGLNGLPLNGLKNYNGSGWVLFEWFMYLTPGFDMKVKLNKSDTYPMCSCVYENNIASFCHGMIDML